MVTDLQRVLSWFENAPTAGAKAYQVAYATRIKSLTDVPLEVFREAHAIYVKQHPGAVYKRAGQYKYKTHRVVAPTKSSAVKVPKVLLFDVETAPMVSYHFSRYKISVGEEQVISESFLICYSAKWLWDDHIYTDCATPDEMLKRTDYRVCSTLWNLINEADIIVAHNAKKADVAWFNSRCIVNGLTPPSPYRIVDTLEVCKRKFGFSSNKLDSLATYFGFEHKLDTDFSLWRKCMEGDQESLDYMLDYNKRDTLLLEEVFIQLIPWCSTMLPNLSTILAEDRCPACGSSDYHTTTRYYYTPLNKYRLYKCETCGAWFRDRYSDKDYKPIFASVVV